MSSDDSFSEVTSDSWFSRIGNAIKGVLFGLFLFVAAFPLLWWNEGRAVHTAQGLKEAGGSVVSIAPDKVDPANDKKLVHVSGLATTPETLTDPQFAVSLNAIKLNRKVEMYQWVEHESSKTEKKLGGGEETTKTWTYDKGWSDKLSDSQKFKKPEGHANPQAIRFPGEQLVAKAVTLGAFKLNPSLVGQIGDFQAVPMDAASRDKLPEELKKQVQLQANLFYLPVDPTTKDVAKSTYEPQVGDLKISFSVVKPSDVSIMARQIGDGFEAWTSSSNTTINELVSGNVSAENMVKGLESQNTMMTWILRGAGFLIMAMGISMIFSPLVVLADVLPFLGNLLQMGLGLFAGLIAAVLSLITIAIAWLAYRPLLGGGLLVVAAGLFVGFIMMGRKKKQAGDGLTVQLPAT